MSPELARALVLMAWAYLAVGAVFALAFLAVGVRHVEPKARGGSPLFYLLIAPGCAALWPLLAQKWRAATRPVASEVERVRGAES